MNKLNTMLLKLDKNKSYISQTFKRPSLKSLSICCINGYFIALKELRITINGKQVNLYNNMNGFNIGDTNIEITEDFGDDGYQHLQVYYKYIDYEEEDDKYKSKVNKFPNLYNSECYIVLNYGINLSEIWKDENIFVFKNAAGKYIN